jgi:hypothetical protein
MADCVAKVFCELYRAYQIGEYSRWRASRVIEVLLDNNPFFRQEDRDHFAQGMRKAGVPR